RIAFLRIGNPAGLSYSDAMVSALHLDGAGVSASGDRFREFVIADRTEAGTRVELDRVVSDLVAFRPHVVIDAGTHTHDEAVARIEAAWPPQERLRPRYVRASTLSEAEPP